MKILIAPDKFKDCLSSSEVARHIAAGIRSVFPAAEIDECPLADGGEGTVAALVAATQGTLHTCQVTGPLPDTKVTATFGFLGSSFSRRGLAATSAPNAARPRRLNEDNSLLNAEHSSRTAVVEMSQASGLYLVPPADRNPMNTTTYGTGELLLAAAEMGADHIILGIGGSATCDAGVGCCQAAGLSVLMKNGQSLSPTDPLCGRDLADVALIKRGRGSPIDRVKISVACDVDNPLFGPRGAAAIFGPQKGATPQDIAWFDAQFESIAKHSNALDAAMHPGAGAAGGLGFAMLAFFNAELLPGFQLIANAVNLRERLRGADLVLTGEGAIDESSLAGKTPVGVAKLCRELNIPCIALTGRINASPESICRAGFTRTIEIAPREMAKNEAIAKCPELLRAAAAAVMKTDDRS